jgi:hypothetical protein
VPATRPVPRGDHGVDLIMKTLTEPLFGLVEKIATRGSADAHIQLHKSEPK